jgi:hypothetical protein
MMKKLLVLALVLSMAVVANAGLTIAYSGGKVVVSDTEPQAGGISVGVAAVEAVDISAVVLNLRTGNPPIAPTLPVDAINRYTNADLESFGIFGFLGGTVQLGWGDAITSTDPADWNPAGEWFNFDLPGYSVGDESDYVLKLVLTDFDVVPLGGEGQALYLNNIVPEPMTMVLLGLGGLFIRRK